MKTNQIFKRTIVVIGMAAVILFVGCTEVLNLLNQASIEQPDAEIEDIKLSELSFKQADLLFNIRISNPNALKIKLNGFDYDFMINGASLIKGDESSGIEIPAQGKTILPLPVSLVFKDVYDIFNGLKDADSLDYTLNAKLFFDLPVIGTVRMPLSYSGALPNLKLPKIALKNIKLEKIGITGADLNLQIDVDNPNSWAMTLNRFNYQLEVFGSPWIKGAQDKQLNISGKSKGVLDIPVSLNFLDMGTSVYKLLTGNEELEYHLTGQAGLGSSIEMLKQFNVPFDKSGRVKLLK